MRTIKFRAWDKACKAMIPDALQVANIGLGDGSLLVNKRAQDGHELDWQQFTGLLDKNGQEIYENDLLRIDMEKFGVSDTVYQVIWDTDGWALKDLDDPDLPSYIFHDKDRQEIIGNIYENPELINVAEGYAERK